MIQTVGTKERRRQIRTESVWPVILRDTDGNELARGRTVNVSQTGIFVMFDMELTVEIGQRCQIEFAVPTTDPGGGARPLNSRINRYTGKIARCSRLKGMVGMGIEFISPFV